MLSDGYIGDSSDWNQTKVVHCKKQPFDVYIGRPSKWGNPFEIGKDGSREEVIAKYRTWLLSNPSLLKDLKQLDGKTLGCWCSPKPCHGDVLRELILNAVWIKVELFPEHFENTGIVQED